MNIIDTNTINHILKNRLALQDDYYLVPDVAEEVDLTQTIHGRNAPNNVSHLSQSPHFDQVIYLDHYNKVLNKYGGRSFYNMTGFGDVSIMAALHMLCDVFDQQRQGRLFDMSEPVVVFTDDDPLKNKIMTEFAGKSITVKTTADAV